MASKKKTEAVETVVRFKGYQLLKDSRYNNRVARCAIDPDKDYTFAEADEVIAKYFEKKG